VKAENPTNFEKVKVGDEVEITYTEALAISFEKAKRSSCSTIGSPDGLP